MKVARNLGKTLRAFQPTIRELQVGLISFPPFFLEFKFDKDAIMNTIMFVPMQDVSREFKSTLEREIGLDDISTPTQNPNDLNRTDTMSTPPSVTSTEDSQTVADPSE